MRKNPLVEGEYYHIYNRGNNQRNVFSDAQDFDYFLQTLLCFNQNQAARSARSAIVARKININQEKLVDIVAFCLNPNHYHLILKQNTDHGISKFMQKIGTGYTQYFNKKYKNNGSLFQGRFKSILVDTDSYMQHLSAYVNLNFKVHNIDDVQEYRSSFDEYINEFAGGFCDKSIVMNSFSSPEKYQKFALRSLQEIKKHKRLSKEIILE